MSKKNDCWGIEVGANAIKAVRLVREGEAIRLAEFDVLPFKQTLTTPDLNVDDEIQLHLANFLERHDISKSAVIASVPGHMAFARFAKLPPVEPKKIHSIVGYEAAQQIPFPIDQVEWDYQVFAQEDSPDVEVGIFAITKDRVANALANYRAMGITLDSLTLSPLAAYNALNYDMDLEQASDQGTIIMDIGSVSTDLIFLEGGAIWLRTMPIGGNNFTEALMRQFKLSYHRAEKLKREAATSKHARQIFQAMRPVFADLVQEVQKSIGYYQSLNRDANLSQLIGLGSTFRLPGMQKFLSQQLQIDVQRCSGFRKLTMEGKEEADLSKHALNMATAYGLALQGLGLESVGANILPAHILKQRMWKAKQPMIGMAAAILLLASLVALGNMFVKGAAYAGGMADAGVDAKVQTTIRQAEGLRREMQETAGGDPRDEMENIAGIADMRIVLPRIIQVVNTAAERVSSKDERLYHPDPDVRRQIPRDQRKRVYIEEITPVYLPPNTEEFQRYARDEAGAADATDGTAADPAMDEFGAEMPPLPEDSRFGEDPTMGMTQAKPKNPGAFKVTIKGWHTYRGGNNYTRELERQLQTMAQLPGRPFKVLETVTPIAREIEEELPQGTTTTGTTPNFGGFGGYEDGSEGFGGYEDEGYGGVPSGGSAAPGSLEDLFPKREPVDPPPTGLGARPLTRWVFEIVWVVQVSEPGDIRLEQLQARRQDGEGRKLADLMKETQR